MPNSTATILFVIISNSLVFFICGEDTKKIPTLVDFTMGFKIYCEYRSLHDCSQVVKNFTIVD
jgi:hypothetical protein